jgi:hypothetical protein
MAFFLQILEGMTPGVAQPILVTRDKFIIKKVAKLLEERLCGDDTDPDLEESEEGDLSDTFQDI